MWVVSGKMRIKAAIAILFFAGIIAAAIPFVDDRSLSPAELENVRGVCEECHGEVPEYEHAIKVHKKHAAFECSFCHKDVSPLKAADSIHKTIEWLCLGALSLVLVGILMNFVVSERRNKAD